MKGYAGKILRMNLTSSSSDIQKLDEKTARGFLGGRGLGTKTGTIPKILFGGLL